MKKLYSTPLFDYRTSYTPINSDPGWRLIFSSWSDTPYWRCEKTHGVELGTLKDIELYSIRNTCVKRGEIDPFLTQVVAEINKRQAVHPLLADATKEQIDELYDRTVKNAVKTKLKGVTEPRNYKHLLNDIQLWRNKHGS